MPKFKHVIILSDGIIGHYHQSLGVAEWLKRLCGAELEQTVNVPKISGLQKLLKLKLVSSGPDYSRKWLSKFGISPEGIEPDSLLISAGSSAAPFALALAKSTANKSAVIMTPSILGTKPFDFAIIPEHDYHNPKVLNILTTLGAPNHIYKPELEKASNEFFASHELGNGKILAVLIGGSDANYKITPEWAENTFGALRYIDGVKILLTTSRRTGAAVDDKIEAIFKEAPALARMILISRNPSGNSITAMLGKATHVVVTEDSVSMVSEAATAGFKVGLIRVPRNTGKIKNLLGYGAQRFDDMFAKMMSKNLIADLGDKPDFMKFLELPEQKHNQDFNEAKRAAEWIINK